MRSVSDQVGSTNGKGPAGNVVPFRRPGARSGAGGAVGATAVRFRPQGQERADQRSLMDLVYATGTFLLAADDRDTKLVASRLQVYGFLAIEEVGPDGTLRRLRPSEAIRAPLDRAWRLSKAAYGAGPDITIPSVTIPAIDGFLFEPVPRPVGA